VPKASSADRDYFARVAAGQGAIADERPPASLAEMFDRLAQIRISHGALTTPGVPGDDTGDLAEHLAFLERVRARTGRGAERP